MGCRVEDELPSISTSSVTEVVLSYEWWHSSSVGNVSPSAGTDTRTTGSFISCSCKGPDVFARVLAVCVDDSSKIYVINSAISGSCDLSL